MKLIKGLRLITVLVLGMLLVNCPGRKGMSEYPSVDAPAPPSWVDQLPRSTQAYYLLYRLQPARDVNATIQQGRVQLSYRLPYALEKATLDYLDQRFPGRSLGEGQLFHIKQLLPDVVEEILEDSSVEDVWRHEDTIYVLYRLSLSTTARALAQALQQLNLGLEGADLEQGRILAFLRLRQPGLNNLLNKQ